MQKARSGWPARPAARAAAALFSLAAVAQAPAPPRPGPEHARLGFFVGRWKTESTWKESPMSPGGKLTGTSECRWFDGDFVVICDSVSASPWGKVKGLAILGYSVPEKTYTYYGLDASGTTMTSVPRGTVEGTTWTFADERNVGGAKVESRYVVEELSPASARYRWEILAPDGNWKTVAEGTQTKK
jgi:hypothetical protein